MEIAQWRGLMEYARERDFLELVGLGEGHYSINEIQVKLNYAKVVHIEIVHGA